MFAARVVEAAAVFEEGCREIIGSGIDPSEAGAFWTESPRCPPAATGIRQINRRLNCAAFRAMLTRTASFDVLAFPFTHWNGR